MGGSGSSSPATGRTPSGQTFRVPATSDMFVTLSSPSHWGPAELFTLSIMAFNLSTLIFARSLPTLFYVANFLLWRCAYNLGLGALLTVQSNRRSITAWLADSPRGTKDLVKWLVTASLPADYAWSRCPLEYNAWVAFRAVSMVVLANDGLTYVVLALAIALKGAVAPAGIFATVVSCVVGLALCVFSLWSKAAAHDCVGDFAWYWGDFFFVMEGELTFAGVYDLFPHPMYTVGYSAYYGISLITRSYTLLYVSLLAHAGQLIFLFLVEEPHIQKIYGPAPAAEGEEDGKNAVGNAAEDSATALSVEGLVGLWRPSVFRAGDVGLYVLLALTVGLFVFGRPATPAAVAYMLAWKVAQWGGLGWVLKTQAESGAWMVRAEREGVSAAAAFETWKQLWNTAWTMSHITFFLTAFYISPNPYSGISDLMRAVGISHVLGAAALVSIAVGTGVSCYETLGGAYGFFYTDFFLLAPGNPGGNGGKKPPAANYRGMYRYFNNPDIVCGYLAYYGVSVFLKSWTVFSLAALCNFIHFLFIALVEMPHLTCTHTGVRTRAALERTLRAQAGRFAEAVPVVGKIRDGVKLRAVASSSLISEKAVNVREAGSRIISSKDQLVTEIRSLNARLREHKLYLRAVEMQQEATTKFKSFDGEEIVALIERTPGLSIERVSELSEDEDDVGGATEPAPTAKTSADRASTDVGGTVST